MKFFKRDKNGINISDKAATDIAKGILKSQCCFAIRLQNLTRNWKQRQQWIFLYFICLLFGGMSIIAIMKPFKTLETSKTIIPKSITVPQNIYKGGREFLITEIEFRKVKEYKSTHPNLLKERPGLYDSLTLIEQSYYLQRK